jgi:hypothetical protein
LVTTECGRRANSKFVKNIENLIGEGGAGYWVEATRKVQLTYARPVNWA